MQYQQVNNMHNNNNHGQRPVRFEHQVQVPMHHPRFGAQMPPQYFAQRPVNINSHYPRSGAQMPARFSVQPPMVINGHYPRSGAQMAPRFLAYQRPMAPQFGALQPVSGRVCRPIGRQGYIRPRPNAIPIVDPATIAQCPEINVSEKVQEKVEILQAKNETVPQHVEALQDETDLRTKDNTIPKKAETPKTIQKWTIQTKRVKAYDCVKPISNKQSKQKLDWSRNSRRWVSLLIKP